MVFLAWYPNNDFPAQFALLWFYFLGAIVFHGIFKDLVVGDRQLYGFADGFAHGLVIGTLCATWPLSITVYAALELISEVTRRPKK